MPGANVERLLALMPLTNSMMFQHPPSGLRKRGVIVLPEGPRRSGSRQEVVVPSANVEGLLAVMLLAEVMMFQIPH